MVINLSKINSGDKTVKIELTREEICDLDNLLKYVLFRPMDPHKKKYTYIFREESLSNVEEKYTLNKDSFERLLNLRIKLELTN